MGLIITREIEAGIRVLIDKINTMRRLKVGLRDFLLYCFTNLESLLKVKLNSNRISI